MATGALSVRSGMNLIFSGLTSGKNIYVSIRATNSFGSADALLLITS